MISAIQSPTGRIRLTDGLRNQRQHCIPVAGAVSRRHRIRGRRHCKLAQAHYPGYSTRAGAGCQLTKSFSCRPRSGCPPQQPDRRLGDSSKSSRNSSRAGTASAAAPGIRTGLSSAALTPGKAFPGLPGPGQGAPDFISGGPEILSQVAPEQMAEMQWLRRRLARVSSRRYDHGQMRGSAVLCQFAVFP